MSKLLVIGLDGATFDLLDGWIKDGKLPTLKRIVQNGVRGSLGTTIPPITPTAWASLVTGKNPGKHGIFDFLYQEKGSYAMRPVDARIRDGKAVWRILSDHGKRVVVINVPATYPPDEVNGVFISGLLTPANRRDYAYPAGVLEELEEALGTEYVIYHREVYSKRSVRKVIEDADRVLEIRLETALYFLKRGEWDFFMVHFCGTDRLQHELWHCMDEGHPRHDIKEARICKDAILEYYQKIDKAIEKILEAAGGDVSVMIVSDHGFGPLHKHLHMNNWLVDAGYLHFKKDIASRVKRKLFKMGLTPANIYRLCIMTGFAGKRIAFNYGTRHKLLRSLFLSFDNVDWSKTKAFATGNKVGQIYINLKGRQPEGAVIEGEYEALRHEITSRLREVKDKAADYSLPGDVYMKEDLYTGSHLDRAPDLVFVPHDLRYQVLGTSDFVSNKIIDGAFDSGDHRLNGIIMAMGSDLKKGSVVSNAQIIDVAPTILYLMGVPIPSDIDGKILDSIFTKGVLDSHKAEYSECLASTEKQESGYTDEETGEIKERLRELGYLG